MEAETRLLEEWKANNDLLKFYEDLKQKRFAHFLTIQTAFLAFFALLAKDVLGALSMSLTALVLISIPPLIISFYFIRVDARSRAFVDKPILACFCSRRNGRVSPRIAISRLTKICSRSYLATTERRSNDISAREI